MIHKVNSFIKTYPNLYPYTKTWFHYLSDIDIQKLLKDLGLCTVFRLEADTVAQDIMNDRYTGTLFNRAKDAEFVLADYIQREMAPTSTGGQ